MTSSYKIMGFDFKKNNEKEIKRLATGVKVGDDHGNLNIEEIRVDSQQPIQPAIKSLTKLLDWSHFFPFLGCTSRDPRCIEVKHPES